MNRTLGPGSLTIGEPASTKEWGGDISKITITPSTDSEDSVPLLDGSDLVGEDTTTWSLKGTAYQAYTMESLAVWCHEHAGEELPFVFTTSTGGLTISGNCKIRPIEIGGDVKKKNTSDFEFPCTSKPTITAATSG